MIHSEKGRTQMKGNTLDIFLDFRAVNIAMRQFLKNQGAIINDDVLGKDAGKEGGSEDGLPV